MEKTIEIKGMDQNLLFGPADINLKLVEDSFKSQIVIRGDIIKLRVKIMSRTLFLQFFMK